MCCRIFIIYCRYSYVFITKPLFFPDIFNAYRKFRVGYFCNISEKERLFMENYYLDYENSTNRNFGQIKFGFPIGNHSV